jgi:hypothetical protein
LPPEPPSAKTIAAFGRAPTSPPTPLPTSYSPPTPAPSQRTKPANPRSAAHPDSSAAVTTLPPNPPPAVPTKPPTREKNRAPPHLPHSLLAICACQHQAHSRSAAHPDSGAAVPTKTSIPSHTREKKTRPASNSPPTTPAPSTSPTRCPSRFRRCSSHQSKPPLAETRKQMRPSAAPTSAPALLPNFELAAYAAHASTPAPSSSLISLLRADAATYLPSVLSVSCVSAHKPCAPFLCVCTAYSCYTTQAQHMPYK